MFRAALLCVVMLAAVPLPQASASTVPYAPTAVAAARVGDTALISWAPGTEMADAYRVYGIIHGTLTRLGEVNMTQDPNQPLSVMVPADFSTYAVSGVKLGAESGLIYAIGGSGGQDCIVIDPPDVGIECIPVVGSPIPARVEIMIRGLPP